MNSFSITSVQSCDAVPERCHYQSAVREFKNEYQPAKWVRVTGVKLLGTRFDPATLDFEHTFSVEWEDPEQ